MHKILAQETEYKIPMEIKRAALLIQNNPNNKIQAISKKIYTVGRPLKKDDLVQLKKMLSEVPSSKTTPKKLEVIRAFVINSSPLDEAAINEEVESNHKDRFTAKYVPSDEESILDLIHQQLKQENPDKIIQCPFEPKASANALINYIQSNYDDNTPIYKQTENLHAEVHQSTVNKLIEKLGFPFSIIFHPATRKRKKVVLYKAEPASSKETQQKKKKAKNSQTKSLDTNTKKRKSKEADLHKQIKKVKTIKNNPSEQEPEELLGTSPQKTPQGSPEYTEHLTPQDSGSNLIKSDSPISESEYEPNDNYESKSKLLTIRKNSGTQAKKQSKSTNKTSVLDILQTKTKNRNIKEELLARLNQADAPTNQNLTSVKQFKTVLTSKKAGNKWDKATKAFNGMLEQLLSNEPLSVTYLPHAISLSQDLTVHLINTGKYDNNKDLLFLAKNYTYFHKNQGQNVYEKCLTKLFGIMGFQLNLENNETNETLKFDANHRNNRIPKSVTLFVLNQKLTAESDSMHELMSKIKTNTEDPISQELDCLISMDNKKDTLQVNYAIQSILRTLSQDNSPSLEIKDKKYILYTRNLIRQLIKAAENHIKSTEKTKEQNEILELCKSCIDENFDQSKAGETACFVMRETFKIMGAELNIPWLKTVEQMVTELSENKAAQSKEVKNETRDLLRDKTGNQNIEKVFSELDVVNETKYPFVKYLQDIITRTTILHTNDDNYEINIKINRVVKDTLNYPTNNSTDKVKKYTEVRLIQELTTYLIATGKYDNNPDLLFLAENYQYITTQENSDSFAKCLAKLFGIMGAKLNNEGINEDPNFNKNNQSNRVYSSIIRFLLKHKSTKSSSDSDPIQNLVSTIRKYADHPLDESLNYLISMLDNNCGAPPKKTEKIYYGIQFLLRNLSLNNIKENLLYSSKIYNAKGKEFIKTLIETAKKCINRPDTQDAQQELDNYYAYVNSFQIQVPPETACFIIKETFKIMGTELNITWLTEEKEAKIKEAIQKKQKKPSKATKRKKQSTTSSTNKTSPPRKVVKKVTTKTNCNSDTGSESESEGLNILCQVAQQFTLSKRAAVQRVTSYAEGGSDSDSDNENYTNSDFYGDSTESNSESDV